MQPTTAREIPMEQTVFTTAWDFLKKYYKVDETVTDREWSQIVDECSQIGEIARGTLAEKFSAQISAATMNYLEVLYKSRKE